MKGLRLWMTVKRQEQEHCESTAISAETIESSQSSENCAALAMEIMHEQEARWESTVSSQASPEVSASSSQVPASQPQRGVLKRQRKYEPTQASKLATAKASKRKTSKASSARLPKCKKLEQPPADAAADS